MIVPYTKETVARNPTHATARAGPHQRREAQRAAEVEEIENRDAAAEAPAAVDATPSR